MGERQMLPVQTNKIEDFFIAHNNAASRLCPDGPGQLLGCADTAHRRVTMKRCLFNDTETSPQRSVSPLCWPPVRNPLTAEQIDLRKRLHTRSSTSRQPRR